MLTEFESSLIINASLLLSVSIVFKTDSILFMRLTRPRFVKDIINGILIGLIGIVLMLASFEWSPGIFFDTRSILLSVSALFWGPVTAITAAVIVVAFRILAGGGGAFMGVLTVLATTAIGIVWHVKRLDKILGSRQITIRTGLEFFLFGLAVHASMLATTIALPAGSRGQILQAIALPTLLIYPVATLLICLVHFSQRVSYLNRKDLADSDHRFRTTVEASPLGIAIVEQFRILYANDRLADILGRTPEQLRQADWSSLTHPDDLARHLKQFQPSPDGKIRHDNSPVRFLKPNGSEVWTDIVVASLARTDETQTGHQIWMIQDITIPIKNKERLEKSEERYRSLYHEFEQKQTMLVSLLDSIPDIIWYKDLDGRYLVCNKAFCELVGLPEEQIIGKTGYDIFGQEYAGSYVQQENHVMENRVLVTTEQVAVLPDNRLVSLEMLKAPYFDAHGELLGIICISRDISERKQKEDEIRYLSYHDTLTGLGNRSFFEKEQQRLRQESRYPISLITGDINGLKLVNDAFGHNEGDKLLQTAARVIRDNCPADAVIARTGGDEFAMLLPNSPPEQAQAVIGQIKKASRELANQFGEELYYTNISLGAATLYHDKDVYEKAFTAAEELMYRQKLLETKSLHSSIIESIRTTLFEKSHETREHADRISDLACRLGKIIGLAPNDMVSLQLVSSLHDIGKISIDENILTKPGKLSDAEWAQVKKHSETGYRIAQTVPELRPIAEFILCHHEAWDGSGYPQGLTGEKIPLQSRIITLADAYDAMTNDRPYQKAMSANAACQEILRQAGRQFDPELARLFVQMVCSQT